VIEWVLVLYFAGGEIARHGGFDSQEACLASEIPDRSPSASRIASGDWTSIHNPSGQRVFCVPATEALPACPECVPSADFNGDGQVNPFDMTDFNAAFKAAFEAPQEP
jgi:hypothetical protein